MPYYKSKYHSKVYRDFKEIDLLNYRRIIRYYEEKEDDIQRLDFEEYFEMLMAYINSLFEIGSYQKHLLMADLAIEMAIVHNIESHQGEDVFQKTLFRKAASLYNILEYEKAEYILRELIRIDPYNGDAILFLKKCLRRRNPRFLNNAKAASIFFFLLAAFVISIEVLFVRTFYKIYTNLIEASRNSIFFLGCATLLLGTLWHRIRVERQVEAFVRQVRSQKEK